MEQFHFLSMEAMAVHFLALSLYHVLGARKSTAIAAVARSIFVPSKFASQHFPAIQMNVPHEKGLGEGAVPFSLATASMQSFQS